MSGSPKLVSPPPPTPSATAPSPPARNTTRVRSTGRQAPSDDAVICERCGVEMFRMHAVWRCPNCRYKTDCCGW